MTSWRAADGWYHARRIDPIIVTSFSGSNFVTSSIIRCGHLLVVGSEGVYMMILEDKGRTELPGTPIDITPPGWKMP